jgi:hypothetical protein
MNPILLAFWNAEKLPIILVFTIFVLTVLLYRAQKKSEIFDIKDLVTEKSGKISLSKFGQLVSLIISSWGFLYLTLNNHLTEMYFTVYMTCWAGFTAVNKALDNYQRTPVDNDTPPEDNVPDDPPTTDTDDTPDVSVKKGKK